MYGTHPFVYPFCVPKPEITQIWPPCILSVLLTRTVTWGVPLEITFALCYLGYQPEADRGVYMLMFLPEESLFYLTSALCCSFHISSYGIYLETCMVPPYYNVSVWGLQRLTIACICSSHLNTQFYNLCQNPGPMRTTWDLIINVLVGILLYKVKLHVPLSIEMVPPLSCFWA